MNLPLTRVCEPDLSASVIVGSPTPAAYHKHIGVSPADAIALFEDVSVTLFHSIMTVASAEVCEPTTTDSDLQVVCILLLSCWRSLIQIIYLPSMYILKVGVTPQQPQAPTPSPRPRVAANTRHNAIQWLCGFW